MGKKQHNNSSETFQQSLFLKKIKKPPQQQQRSTVYSKVVRLQSTTPPYSDSLAPPPSPTYHSVIGFAHDYALPLLSNPPPKPTLPLASHPTPSHRKHSFPLLFFVDLAAILAGTREGEREIGGGEDQGDGGGREGVSVVGDFGYLISPLSLLDFFLCSR